MVASGQQVGHDVAVEAHSAEGHAGLHKEERLQMVKRW